MFSTASGSVSRRSVLATAGRLLPRRSATLSCVRPHCSISRFTPMASSTGFRSSRCRFSTSAASIRFTSSQSRMIAGISVSPAKRAARQRRSPAMMVYRRPFLLTSMG